MGDKTQHLIFRKPVLTVAFALILELTAQDAIAVDANPNSQIQTRSKIYCETNPDISPHRELTQAEKKSCEAASSLMIPGEDKCNDDGSPSDCENAIALSIGFSGGKKPIHFFACVSERDPVVIEHAKELIQPDTQYCPQGQTNVKLSDFDKWKYPLSWILLRGHQRPRR